MTSTFTIEQNDNTYTFEFDESIRSLKITKINEKTSSIICQTGLLLDFSSAKNAAVRALSDRKNKLFWS